MFQSKKFTTTLDNVVIEADFNNFADQADGSVVLSAGDTVVLATVVMSKEGNSNPGYFNLTVEYIEKFYAAGKILGSRYNHQEGKPTTKAVLSSRIIDRTIRPFFDQRIPNAVQVIVNVLSLGDVDPTFLAINAVSLALGVSNIPWNGPVAGIHITQDTLQSDLVTVSKPNNNALEICAFDLFLCSNLGGAAMIECGGIDIDEDTFKKHLDLAYTHTQELLVWQQSIIKELTKEKRIFTFDETRPDLIDLFKREIEPRLVTCCSETDSKSNLHDMQLEWVHLVKETFKEDVELEKLVDQAFSYFDDAVNDFIHMIGLKESKRIDLRPLDKVRGIYAKAGGISKRLHGSGVFYRGETHVLSVVTLGGPEDRQLEEGMEISMEKRFFHTYNFPPFSAGETGRVGGMNRRQIGHGMLAEKALTSLIPDVLEFPYTIRIVSESLASNGSTSQASICASSLALMDAGVPIKKHCAGVAMGALIDPADSSKYVIITDIQGPEDHHGDMDFKVAGTTDGICAIQLDIKVSGIPLPILKDALGKAKNARLGILSEMNKEIAASREHISEFAPYIGSTQINPDKIGMVIGGGGKNIQKLQEDTQTKITIEDDGKIFVTGKREGVQQAIASIDGMTRVWIVGDKATGTVKAILDGVGAIVALSDFADGMVHISEIASFRIEDIKKHLSVGANVPVTVISVDHDRGRIGLSIKKDNPEFVK